MKSKTQSYWVPIGILLFTYLLTSSYVFAAPRKVLIGLVFLCLTMITVASAQNEIDINVVYKKVRDWGKKFFFLTKE